MLKFESSSIWLIHDSILLFECLFEMVSFDSVNFVYYYTFYVRWFNFEMFKDAFEIMIDGFVRLLSRVKRYCAFVGGNKSCIYNIIFLYWLSSIRRQNILLEIILNLFRRENLWRSQIARNNVRNSFSIYNEFIAQS